jgi:hypothetical protein
LNRCDTLLEANLIVPQLLHAANFNNCTIPQQQNKSDQAVYSDCADVNAGG